MKTLRLSLLFLLTVCAGMAQAQQDAVIERGNTQVGTIQVLDQGAGYITISGRQYGYDDELLRVFYDGDLVDSIILDQGIVVRFRVNSEQIVTQMELLGPTDKIQSFFEH
ncbi:MAG: hypothetical protein AB8B95_11110 [Pseudohongiellaceae bacterium]